MVWRFILVAAASVTLGLLACSSDSGTAPFRAGSRSSSSSSSSSGGSNGSTSNGSTSSSGATGNTSITCHDAAKLTCDLRARCLTGFLTEPSTCVRDQELECDRSSKLAGATAVSAIPASCVQKFQSVTCPVVLDGEALDSSCIVKGALENGAPCEDGQQCKSGNCHVTGDSCGTCADFAAEGAPCDDADCAFGLHCLGPATTGKTCVKLGALNDACGSRAACHQPNVCVGGSCTARLEDGKPCTFNNDNTEDDPCLNSCVRPTPGDPAGTCGVNPANITSVGKGGSCASGSNHFCAFGTTCHGASGAETCVVDATTNESCSDTDGPECAAHLKCVSGKCVEDPLDLCK